MKLADALGGVPGVEVLNETFFNEFTIRLPRPAAEVVEALGANAACSAACRCRVSCRAAGLDDLLLVTSTEVNTDEDRAAFVSALKEALA